MLEYLQQNGQINLLSENNINILKDNIAWYPIIFVCNNEYLQLSTKQINEIAKHIKKGGLLIMDNITSDYTYSFFIEQLLPEFEKENIQVHNIFVIWYLTYLLKKFHLNRMQYLLTIKLYY